jgi:hypothetical protein
VCAMSLAFIVTATQVGVEQGRLDPTTAAAVTTAGLIGVCLFPALGVRLLRLRRGAPSTHPLDHTVRSG